jgi:hypothetical protein
LVRVESPPFPVTTPKGLKGMMQKLRGPNLPPEVQERITKSLTELMTRPVEVKAAAPTKKTA